MSVRNSVAATIASRVYLMLVGLVMLPVYMRQLGLEAYGLVALFFVLQVWFQLLDLGLTPTLAREAARHRAGALSPRDLRLLLRSVEGLFIAVVAVAGAVLFLGAEQIARRWLHAEHLSQHEVTGAIEMMAICVMVRLLGELYRGAISGFERQTWLAGFNTVFGTVRLVLVVPYLHWAGASLSNFFAFQIVATAVETVVLVVQTYRLIPRTRERATPWRLAPIRRVFAFSLVMFLASVVWITTSQIDKLILSGMLPLAGYGAFSLAVTAAGGVLMVSGSLADVLIPRLTRLHAEGAQVALMLLYRRATQWVGMMAWPIACILAVHSERVLWIWTGDASLATRAAPVLGLYALGNAMLAVGALPYYLQFAQGQLRLHLLGTALMVALLLPCVVWATARHGAAGAAAVWLGVNALYLLLWAPVAHARSAPGIHREWLLGDVMPIASLAALAAVASHWLPWPSDRWGAAMLLLPVSAAVLLVSAAGSSWARGALLRSL